MIKNFSFNSFVGVSAPMLLLVPTEDREHLFKSVKSRYLKDKIYNLLVEVEVLDKVLSNMPVEHRWAVICDDIYNYKDFNIQGLRESIGGLEESDIKVLVKKLYYMGKDYLNGNMSESKYGIEKNKEVENIEDELDSLDIFGDLNIECEEQVENNLDRITRFIYEMLQNRSEELSEFMKFYIDFCDSLGNPKRELRDVTSDTEEYVRLSDKSYRVLEFLYENKQSLKNIKTSIKEVLQTSTTEFSSDDLIFGVPIHSLKQYTGKWSFINSNINKSYIESIEYYTMREDFSEREKILEDYTQSCRNLFKLMEEDDEGLKKDFIKVESYRMSDESVDYEGIFEQLRSRLSSNGILSDEVLESRKFRMEIQELFEINNFLKLLESDLENVYDILRVSEILRDIDKGVYERYLGEEVDEEELIEVFEELSKVGIVGLTLFSFERFKDLLEVDSLKSSKFRLEKESMYKLYQNSKLMQKDIESKEYFM